MLLCLARRPLLDIACAIQSGVILAHASVIVKGKRAEVILLSNRTVFMAPNWKNSHHFVFSYSLVSSLRIHFKTQSKTAQILGTTQVQISRRERKILKWMRKELTSE